MEVSFKGFKNTGVQRHVLYNYAGKKRAELTIFNCELTNDVKGKDLDTFEKILKDFPNKVNKNFLNIGFWRYSKNPHINSFESKFFINQKVCTVDMTTLGIFEKIAQLLKRITDTKEQDFVVNKDYLKSDDMRGSFLMDDEEDDMELISNMHNPEAVKTISKKLLDNITDSVEDVLS